MYSGSVCLSKVQTTVYVPYEVNYYLKAKLEVSLLVLRQLANGKAVAFSEIESAPFVSKYRLRQTLQGLCDKEFIEPTGRTSGLKYILHVGLRKTVSEKIEYAKARKQTKAKNIESILRYLDSVPDINNAEAREILKLPEKKRSLNGAMGTLSKEVSM